ncbi:MAG TPA: MFS transporter [Chloroflexota bacterium]|jgi:CP family cyanate transporter-like MFS transporter|nr:MFS transporter [Chloroflexota bacterium]
MAADAAGTREAALPPLWLSLSLLWLAGICLRLTLLAVPPLLPTIHHDLHLDETAVGALTALPVLILALASVPGSLLVAHLGARRVLALGLILVGAGGALRGLGHATLLLFVMTVLMGAGIAVAQPTLPSLARAWCGVRNGLATATYSNGLLIGEIASAALTAPLLIGLVGGNWSLALAAWSLPVALTALAVLGTPRTAGGRTAVPARWWPDWRSGRTWRLGLVLGCAGISYFAGNTFIPEYLKTEGHANLVDPALTSLNLAQLPVSFLILAIPNRLIGRRMPFIVAGALIMLAAVGFSAAIGPGYPVGAVFWAGLLGMAAGSAFTLSLALPPLVSPPHDVHRLSAAMFTISYSLAFAGPLVGGAIWDHTGRPALAFIPIISAGALMILLAIGLIVPGHEHPVS